MKITKKYYREYLNNKHREDVRHKHFRFHQRTREYGDYLYYQDRVRFDMLFEMYKTAMEKNFNFVKSI